MNELNSLLADHPAYPLESSFYNDPEWTVWAEIAEAISAGEDAG